MSTPLSTAPLRYDASLEHLEEGEAETTAELIETMRHIAETTFKDGGRGLRGVHAKSHGLVKGELRILDGLPAVLSQGLFAQPGTYSVVMRFSTSPGDMLSDKISTPRGVAIKVLCVDGPRVPGSEDATTQDFIMVNGPAFSASTAKAFAKNAKLLASTTDKAEGLKKAFSAVARGTEKLVEAAGGKSATLTSLGGHPLTHILGETFYTQVPVLYGSYMAKLSLAPVSSSLTALTGQPVDLSHNADGLRTAVEDFFETDDAQWELRVQLCTDIEKMPIEDAAVVWPEDQSPYVVVATISASSQDSWPGDASAVEDRLSFNPWHALAAHRPLGSIMRVRKAVYEASVAFRAKANGLMVAEPASPDEVASS